MRLLKGFTLLELLVALAIFSILGLAGYQLLRTITDSHSRLQAELEVQTELGIALAIMQRDFEQYVERPVRDEYGERLSPIALGEDDYQVQLTRGGWRNPTGRPRSTLQRVAYSVDYEQKTLNRHFWTVLDRAEDSVPITQTLLSNVEDFTVSAFSPEDEEGETFVDSGLEEAAAMPAGVRIVIATMAIGEIERIFQLAETHRAAQDDRYLGEDQEETDEQDFQELETEESQQDSGDANEGQ